MAAGSGQNDDPTAFGKPQSSSDGSIRNMFSLAIEGLGDGILETVAKVSGRRAAAPQLPAPLIVQGEPRRRGAARRALFGQARRDLRPPRPAAAARSGAAAGNPLRALPASRAFHHRRIDSRGDAEARRRRAAPGAVRPFDFSRSAAAPFGLPRGPTATDPPRLRVSARTLVRLRFAPSRGPFSGVATRWPPDSAAARIRGRSVAPRSARARPGASAGGTTGCRRPAGPDGR